MEVFAVAANVMAAVSITLQLVDTIEKLKDFWKGMRNAPREVEQIIGDLELLEGILEGVRKAYVRCYLELIFHHVLTTESQGSAALSSWPGPSSGCFRSCCSSTMSEACS